MLTCRTLVILVNTHTHPINLWLSLHHPVRCWNRNHRIVSGLPGSSASSLKDPGIKWFPHYGLCSYTQSRLHLPPFSSNLHGAGIACSTHAHRGSLFAYMLFIPAYGSYLFLFSESKPRWIKHLIDAKAARVAHSETISRAKHRCTAQEYFLKICRILSPTSQT